MRRLRKLALLLCSPVKRKYHKDTLNEILEFIELLHDVRVANGISLA